MWKKSGLEQTLVGIYERVLGNAIVATFVVFLAQAHSVVTEREQEMVVAIMMGLIERTRFSNELFVTIDQCRWNVEGPRVVGHNIKFVRERVAGSQGNDFREFA